jgi:hypothetical protein
LRAPITAGPQGCVAGAVFNKERDLKNETDDYPIGNGHTGHRDLDDDTDVPRHDAGYYERDAGSNAKGARVRGNAMKQFIVLIAMLALGLAIYGMIAGPDEDSVLSTMKGVWADEIELRTREP